MKIIFTDTNKILLALKYRHKDPLRIHQSWLYHYIHASHNTFYVSYYVLQELYVVYNRKFTRMSEEEIFIFLDNMWFQVVYNTWSYEKFDVYVYDKNDAPILRDAVYIDADYLWTHNTRDFKTDLIYEKFLIKVVQHLPKN